jgi:outer membrane protein assembly factor BamB
MTFAKFTKNALPLLAFAGLLSACNGFFDKDNTPTPKPLVNFTQQVQPQRLWSTDVGSGSSGDTLKMTPSIDNHTLYSANANGVVTAISLDSGSRLWKTDTDTALTTGTAADQGIVVVGSRHGDVIALNESNGHILWKISIKGELLANPAIANQRVVLKTVDGSLTLLDANTGKTLWTQQQTEPTLILRASSTPVITNRSVVAGFANGNLVKLNLASGQLDWLQPIATPNGIFPIERMIDIDANPVVYHDRVFAATYQGNIASLALDSGQVLWSHDISSYTGMDVDDSTAFITDARGYVYSFDASSGLVNWRQTDLEARVLTAPVIMGNTVVVGDAQGYLHWLSRQDGHFLGRVSVGSPLFATPLVDNNVLYALTNKGTLSAYRLASS